jgi:flagella basal body P-ring formation protein FlgA
MWVLAALPLAAPAQEIQTQAEILEVAESYLRALAEAEHGSNSDVRMGSLDPRLRLAACNGNLEGFLPPGGRARGNTTVGVRCLEPGGWTVYLSAQVSLFGKVLMLRHPVARGEPLSAEDLVQVERDLASLSRGYLQKPEQAIGRIARRALGPDTLLTPSMVEAPRLVHRGERVVLTASQGGFEVRMTGRSLVDGTEGELVRVRADTSQRIVEGIVVSPGVVKVTL